MEEIEKEKITETVNEVNDGRKEVWIYNNHLSLVNEFIEDEKEAFNEYCQLRWRESNES